MIKKGKFKKVGETLSVPPGDTLELRCRGRPVQWSVPIYLQEDHDGRLKYATFSIHYISQKKRDKRCWKCLVGLKCLKYGFNQTFLFRPCRTVQQERYGVLRVVNSTGADTGEYACYPLYCEDTDCRREYDKAAKVFVFFPGTKPRMSLFVCFFNIFYCLTKHKTKLKTT